MIDDHDYFDLPEDYDLAFLKIERDLRNKLQLRLDGGDDQSPFLEWYQDYINSVLGAARGLGIEAFNGFEIPTNRISYHDEYRAFTLAVDQYVMQVRIRHSRRVKRYSVALDSVAKEKIMHHLTQLKELTNKLEISNRKREAIIAKILALESEVERERTRFEVVGALIVESATVAGEAGEKLEPWRKWIDSIAKLIGVAKESDVANPSLPLPEERKRIEPPRRKLPPPDSGNIDDDIPF